MFKKIILTFILFTAGVVYSNTIFAANEEPVYTQFRVVDVSTFNEFRYKMTDEFFNLRNKYELDWKIDVAVAGKILELAKKGYLYLPDSLSNKNYFNYLKTSIERGIKYPLNASNYTSIVGSIENYLDKTNIQSIKGTVEAFPKEWNAPLNVTLRWSVRDPSGTKIPWYNYTWWMQVDGKRKVLWNNISLNYIFKEEWNFAIFLDVKSAHKNNWGYTDVLPFSSRANITINEKIASVLVKVNSSYLRDKEELKFTPDEAKYWLLIDATSSTPTSGSRFAKTTWDFWNGIKKSYTGSPKVERVVYVREWEYTVTLELKTNELKTIKRKFKISVHDPIATIKSSQEEWYLWDKFTFSAQKTWNDKNLSYAWEIIDLKEDKIIFKKVGTLFTYTFNNKGKYNIKMKVTEPSGQTDVDSKIIHINSRAPTSDFVTKIPYSYKPNRVFFDGTKSFDPDFTDDWKLKYSWIIDWDRINLSEPNYNGSTWYFTFDSVWEHSVTLEVEDPDKMISLKKGGVKIKSILSVEFYAFPRVAQRENKLRFVSNSPEAKFYEWDFWDGTTKWWRDSTIGHSYSKSWIFNVKLRVRDSDDHINTFKKNVYIWDSNSPYSFINIKDKSKLDTPFDESACDGKWAYIVNRVDSVKFSWDESINITWETSGLTYSWKLWRDSYKNTKDFTKKFDELGCFPIKLTVKSIENWKTHSTTSFVEVRNIKPILSSIDVRVVDSNTDPVIVNVSALWAKDRDGVIQSYLWYYYTDIDSEPQDFRATKWPNTSFVLPKVTWNYYFVVVMKDNNEERIDSEEITGSKYFMTLTGDNLNTPLVQLKINDSAIAIWDEAIFTANVENILWQNLTKKVKYSWDFDGDWFYDKDTDSNVVIHNYISSWEMHAKVKAKYKWFSNTKTVTVEVSNVLKPDFWYISIGNKFVYFYNWIWTAEHYEWELWDETKITDKEYFIHEYTDWKVIHLIDLKVSEWTKIKTVQKKVLKNVKNRILAAKEWLVSFISPKPINNEIILEKNSDNVFVYLGESKWQVKNYIVDYDIEYDSDVNGWNDDDEDNKDSDSYTDWSIIKVELNKNRYQKIRVYITNDEWIIINSKDYTIVKKYIEEKLIDINNINFEWITDSTRLKIEKLKNYVDALPKQHKLKGSMYIQHLQEEWFDNREKTNIILEFEWFILDTWVSNSEEIVNLLEWLLVENQEDKSEKAITFNALKNLIPESIVCKDPNTLEETMCYDIMVAKLEAIKNNDNIDENKVLWTEILKIVAVDKIMTNKEKTDFKAILKTFIYWGVVNIPDSEKNEISNEDNSNSSWLLGLIYSIFYWIAIIILTLIGFIVLFYIYFKLFNRDSNIWFQDFIIEKTSWEKKIKPVVKDTFEEDLLSDLSDEKESIEKEEKEVEKIEEIKTEEATEQPKVEPKEIKEEKIKEEVKSKDKATSWEEVPDWLKWSFSEEKKSKATEQPKVEPKKIKNEKIKEEVKSKDKATSWEEVPDWLKWDFSEEVKEEAQSEMKEVKTKKIEEKKKPIINWKSNKVKKIDQDKKEDNIPDWLKWSFSEEVNKKEVKSDDVINKSINDWKVEKIDQNQKEDNIPDWLKWSFSEEVDKKEVKSKDKTPKKWTSDKIDWKKVVENKPKKVVNKKPTEKNIEKSTTKKINDSNKIEKITKNETKKDNIENKEEVKPSELWDDWMKVPDWLKSDDDK